MKEVAITATLLEKIASGLGPDAILVGGQALATWVAFYRIDAYEHLVGPSISDDADFLGVRSNVMEIATTTHGTSVFPTPREITALVGQVHIPVSQTEFVNVDVLHRIVGLDAAAIRNNAQTLQIGDAALRIMSPLDILVSRVENLRKLEDKRNSQGIMQARLAIPVVRAHILEYLNANEEKPAISLIERVAKIAKSAAGRMATRDFGVSFLLAIPHEAVKNAHFQKIRWPRMVNELNMAAGLPCGPVRTRSKSGLKR